MATDTRYTLLGASLGLSLMVGACGDTSGESATDTASGTDSGSTDTANTLSGSDTNSGPSGTDSDSDTNGTDISGTDTDTATGVTDTDTTAPGTCGDGNVDDGEDCDDGNNEDGDGCSAACTIEAVCGNGEVETGEDCDDGNNEDGDGCDAECHSEVVIECGNGVIEGEEDCDDGNNVPQDGCEDDCTVSASECGNNILEPWGMEECDDGNNIPQDGCENDCTVTKPPECQPLEAYVPCDQDLNKGDPLAPFHAIGVGCSNDPLESILISDHSFNSPIASAWQIAKGFGTYVDPMTNELLYSAVEGDAFLIISSGFVSAPNGNGVVTEQMGMQDGNGDNNNPDDDSLPPGMSVQKGSNNGNGGTPGENCKMGVDCSDSLLDEWNQGMGNPNDKIWFSWSANVPNAVMSYTLSFAFFSSEWPYWYDTAFNDLMIVWESSEDYWGNISVIDGLPTTITALHPHWSEDSDANCNGPEDMAGPGFSCSEPQLQGTGFEGNAGTDWITINRPITAGEDLTVYVFLADMQDSILATGALIDNFRWLCEECIPADDPLCTGEVPDPNCCGVILPM